MNNPTNELLLMLEVFTKGENCSLEFANKIEGFLIEYFPEDPDLDDLSDAFASYSPAGGEYLYDQKSMTVVANGAIRLLRRRIS